MLANLNSLNNKSGLNKKSIINNTSVEGYPADDQPAPEISPFLRSLFEIFWSNVPYISNPFEDSHRDDGLCSKDKLMQIIRGMSQMLTFFKNNPIDEENPIIRRYPKYIKDIRLFSYQINEPYFRKSVLVQLKFMLFNIENNLKVSGKQIEPLNESEAKEVKVFEDTIGFLLKCFKPFENKPKKHLNEVITKLLSSEKNWMKWKEEGCQPYSKSLPASDIEKFRNEESLADREPVDDFIRSKEQDIRSWLNIDKRFDHEIAYNRGYLCVWSYNSDIDAACPSLYE